MLGLGRQAAALRARLLRWGLGESLLAARDGHILVAGATIDGGTPSPDGAEDLLLEKFHADGSPDTILARDGQPDRLDGGGGIDQAQIDDGSDRVSGVESLLA